VPPNRSVVAEVYPALEQDFPDRRANARPAGRHRYRRMAATDGRRRQPRKVFHAGRPVEDRACAGAQTEMKLRVHYRNQGDSESSFSAAGEVVVALRMFLLSASDGHDTGLDGTIGVECRSAVPPRAVLEADCANPPKPNTELRRFLRICF
jgi:hypothetical protein